MSHAATLTEPTEVQLMEIVKNEWITITPAMELATNAHSIPSLPMIESNEHLMSLHSVSNESMIFILATPCTQCASYLFLDTSTGNCVDSCPSGTYVSRTALDEGNG